MTAIPQIERMHGVCVDALNETACPDPRMLIACGLTAARQVAFSHSDRFYRYAASLLNAGLYLPLVFTDESFQSGDIALDTKLIAENIPATIWVVGNEQDAWLLSEDSPSSNTKRPEVFAPWFKTVAEAILKVRPDALIVIGGWVSGHAPIMGEYLQEIRKVYTGPIHGYDNHLYGKNAAEMLEAFEQFDQYAEPGMWGYELELNRPVEEIAEYVAALGETNWCWFGWSDGQTEQPMGLVDADGWPKEELRALSRVL